MYSPSLSQEQINHYWDGVSKLGPDECWNWDRGLNGKGPITCYGVIWFDGKKHKTHRLSMLLSRGPFDENLMVCHKCDNPRCCNPNHLFIGTAKDNSQDCKSKGRMNRELGSQRYNAKLTEEAVAEIKAQAPFRKYGWGRAMAKKYGVAPTAINNIVRGRRWRQIGENGPIEALTSPHSHNGFNQPLNDE